MPHHEDHADRRDEQRFQQRPRDGVDRAQDQRRAVVAWHQPQSVRQAVADLLQSAADRASHRERVVSVLQMDDAGDRFVPVLLKHAPTRCRADRDPRHLIESDAATTAQWQ